jgi:hypothetical protein
MPAAVRALRSITLSLPAEQGGKGKSWFESASTANNLNILSFSVSLSLPEKYYGETMTAAMSGPVVLRYIFSDSVVK